MNMIINGHEIGPRKTHRSYRSIFAGPGCRVTSHRQCAVLPLGDASELDPTVSDPVDACDDVHVADENPSVHPNRKHQVHFAVTSF